MAESVTDFIAGSAAGFAGKLLDYPLDTVKVLLQTQSVNANVDSGTVLTEAASSTTSTTGKASLGQPRVVYRGSIHCLQHTINTQGFFSLYKGLSSPLLGSMAENAVLFLVYNSFKRLLAGEFSPFNNAKDHGNINNKKEDLTLLQISIAGAGAGAVVPFVLTPVELIKCRLQVQNAGSNSGFRTYKGPLDVIVQTIKTDGIANGLYRGNSATLMREIPGNAAWYGVYEGVCKLMTPEGGSKADLGTSAHLIGGASAGVAYWTAFYPADTVKSYIQTNPNHNGSTFVRTMMSLYRSIGIRGLYRGWGITAARAAPSHAAIFATYEYAMKLMTPDDKTYDLNSEVSFSTKESIRT
mmetsp:Transcript_16446/g.25573  ORF Transcript_16446/g.25573 Transcript_16446/m.25573 type:complete len:354 (+) Transcript_16446:208-1269(+)|eukprot:CAMPEP_0195294982 /NCGR_PEP_ID=MMETSP0707-20130614/16327_1 /TAXON_ID=33640 /ORGANISM="Asterionellopsis glacialis, Strain CCMP134" /LENGTH=353 /DNA_ID=CAMNT_0040356089 /DNA_START=185 /DNA_END=1246 /DNA_ORIENTATION=+